MMNFNYGMMRNNYAQGATFGFVVNPGVATKSMVTSVICR